MTPGTSPLVLVNPHGQSSTGRGSRLQRCLVGAYHGGFDPSLGGSHWFLDSAVGTGQRDLKSPSVRTRVSAAKEERIAGTIGSD